MKNRYGVLTKSNNAIIAEENGLKTYSNLKAWQKRAVDKGTVRAAEWHHTGAAANRTDYYDPEDFADLNPADFPAKKKEKANQADLKRLKIEITFEKMVHGFTTRHKTFETITVEGLDVRKSDNVITGAGGRRITSNNKEVKYFYKKPRARNFKEITEYEAMQLGYKFI